MHRLLAGTALGLVYACLATVSAAQDIAAPPTKDAAPAAAAETAAPVVAARPTIVLDEMVVTATRSLEAIKNTASTVTVITEQQMQREMVNSIRDITRYEPGVSTSRNSLGAQGSYVIRGISGNRVLLMTDGIRLPDFTESGHSYNRDAVDLDSVKRVEIVRGPASSLYGSDALGGIVAYFTKDPEDYLGTFGRDTYISAKTGYDSGSDLFTESVTGAMRAGGTEALIQFTRRDGHELDAKGFKDNPQDFWSNNLLGKLVAHPTDDDTVKMTGEFYASDLKTDLRTDLAASVLDSRDNTITQRARLSFEHEHTAPIGFMDSIKWKISYQDLNQWSNGDQLRLSRGQRVDRSTSYNFTQQVYNGDVQAESNFAFGDVRNRLTYGIDLTVTETSRPRNRTECNQVTGRCSSFVGLEYFPAKNFPDTTSVLAGAFLQDEIDIGDTGIRIVPGVRLDYYNLQTHPDREFYANNPRDTDLADMSAWSVSPKLGLIYDLTDEFTVYGQYSHGFRAPPYDTANLGFDHRAIGYIILPNPNLRPETSDGVEVGLRGNFANGSNFSVSGYYTRFEDFISQETVGISREYPFGIFEYRNINRATIWGMEATGTLVLDDNVSVRGSLAYANGEDGEGDPLPNIQPLKAVAGLRYDNNGDWGGEFTGTYLMGVRDVGRDPNGYKYFQTPDAAVFDVTAYWNVSPNISLNAGVFNVFDEEYWLASDIGSLSPDNPANTSLNVNRYAQPGRTFRLSATARW